MVFERVSAEEINKISRFYKTLSDATRLKILLALDNQEMNVSTLVVHLDMEQSAVSHQLRLLRENRLVKTRREGKTVFYSIDDQHVIDILKETMDHLSHV
ncbi:ArsR/SmtB family transcription factor [Vagococcus vulneris]|uniref:Transcriptional regulator n=1 Tax=Vagococcus vulneris TaxID=1977869 RepID=A0A430A203_9ENTE|nr:metalloregulator ArsR/SmtB family transcription factor [Vagococcus vulneris]RSU00442.1 transcriptional regulator [Vagococcus vulneris]